MLSIKDLSKEYADREILSHINISIKETDKIGLIGCNGSGKSTLFKILVGEINPDTGVIDNSNDILGYLPQNPHFEDISIGQFIDQELANNTSRDYLIKSILTQLGLEAVDKDIKCTLLSGGQKTKLILANLVLRDPKVTMLILDEPTNNLDITSLDWLELFIKNFNGGLILTSHDRFFLDRVCNKIIELKNGKIKTYGGNYSFYKQQCEIEEQAYAKMYVVQQKQINKTLDNIHTLKEEALTYEHKFSSRNPYEKKKAAKSVKNAINKENKLQKLLNSTEYLDKPQNIKKYGVTVPGTNPQGKLMLSVNNLSFSYGDKLILNNISFRICGSGRTWLIGKNGSGKTTLIKTITNQLIPTSGEIKLGVGNKIGYLSQDSSNLTDAKTGIEELAYVCNDMTQCFRMASHLYLTQKDLVKKISHLSSGQKVKLEFAKLLLAGNNLIIMDEPTNHLEIDTREEIEKALQEYKGAILVASHDRYFIEKLGITDIVELF